MRTIGYIRPHRSCTAQKQRAAMEAAGITTIYVEGQGAETLNEAIRALRPGTRLAVMHAALLAEPARTTKSRPRDSLFKAIEDVKKRGGVLWEVEKDRASDTDCVAIIKDAVDMLAAGGRSFRSAANGAKSPGRPKFDWSPWIDIMKREWRSLEHRTNHDAVLAMQRQGVPVKDTRQAEHVLKASGRAKQR